MDLFMFFIILTTLAHTIMLGHLIRGFRATHTGLMLTGLIATQLMFNLMSLFLTTSFRNTDGLFSFESYVGTIATMQIISMALVPFFLLSFTVGLMNPEGTGGRRNVLYTVPWYLLAFGIVVIVLGFTDGITLEQGEEFFFIEHVGGPFAGMIPLMDILTAMVALLLLRTQRDKGYLRKQKTLTFLTSGTIIALAIVYFDLMVVYFYLDAWEALHGGLIFLPFEVFGVYFYLENKYPAVPLKMEDTRAISDSEALSGTLFFQSSEGIDMALTRYSRMVHGGYYGLALTKHDVGKLRRERSVNATPIVELSVEDHRGSIPPNRLWGIDETIRGFMERVARAKGRGVILIDGIDYLWSNNVKLELVHLIRLLKRRSNQTGTAVILTSKHLMDAEKNTLSQLDITFKDEEDEEDEMDDQGVREEDGGGDGFDLFDDDEDDGDLFSPEDDDDGGSGKGGDGGGGKRDGGKDEEEEGGAVILGRDDLDSLLNS